MAGIENEVADNAPETSGEASSDTKSADTQPAHAKSQFSDTLFSRLTLLLVTLGVLALLALAAAGMNAVNDGAGVVLAVLTLIGVLVIGGFVRYRCRIGLRSFLVLVTAFSVILAVVAQFAIRVRAVSQGVKELRDRGASVSFGLDRTSEWQQTESGFPMPPWLLNTFGEAAFSNAVQVDFYQGTVSREDAQRLLRFCPKVRYLNFYQAKIEPGALKGMGKGLTVLEHLELSGTNIGNDDFREAVEGAPNLQSVFFRFTQVDDGGMDVLATLPRLKSVWLEGAAATDEGIKAIGSHSNLQMLLARNTGANAFGATGLTDAALEGLADRLPNLENIDMTGNWRMKGGGAEIARFSKLKFLNLSSTSVNDQFLDDLGETGLRSIYLKSTDVTLEGLKRFHERNPDCKIEHPEAGLLKVEE